MDTNTFEIELNTLKIVITKFLSDKFTGRSLARAYNEEFHTRIDWHEFSDMLAQWNCKGIVTLVGHDTNGMCEYRLISK